ncbi:MAG TPA: tRNA lysidine(34) synthetase TilS [Kiritimatiellia bacterium]|nr:tRNA lysidine(34) synthetase TilS [Kiritimatiellia bacterium]HMP32885.1 tRNA lysidine(34) synthetase TilS [Kiritimatiellia bacterium]
MLRRIDQTIRDRALLHRGQHVVVGCSGGADSIALLHALWFLRDRWQLRLTVAHLHHGLRGADADADANFVRDLCARRGLPLLLERIALPDVLAVSPGQSMEMAARAARHAFFLRALRETGADAVALAHHRDDQAETVLMRLLGGAGLDGLAGMAYRAEPQPGLIIIRPMLDMSRAEARAFLHRHHLTWRDDASNTDLAILRNRVRHRLLPMLAAEGFPGAVAALVRLADIAREEHAGALAWRMQQKIPRRDQPLPWRGWSKRPVAEQRRRLRAWLQGGESLVRAVDFRRIEAIRRLAAGLDRAPVRIAGVGWVDRERDRLIVRNTIAPKGPGAWPEVSLAVPGMTRVPGRPWQIRIEATTGFRKIRGAGLGVLPAEAYLARRAGEGAAWILRARRPGERIAPTGLAGSVALKELFINHKIPVAERDGVPVLVIGPDVAWVAGYRVARHHAVPGPDAPSWHIRIEQIPMAEVVSNGKPHSGR